VDKIYNFDESKNMIEGRHPNGGRWERAEILTYDEYEQYLLTSDVQMEKNGEDNLIEANCEAHNRKNKLSTIEFLQGNLNFDKQDINISNLSKVNIDSPFKRYHINKAIGHAIAKNNLTLKSKYTIPEIEILSDFINNLAYDNALSTNIILLTVLTGISQEKIIDALAGFDTQLKFLKQESKFRITSSKKLFANFDNSEDVVKEVSNEYVEIYIPLVLARVWLESVREVSDTYKHIISSMLGEDVEAISKNIESEKNNAASIHNKLMKQLDIDNKNFNQDDKVGKKLKVFLVEKSKEYLKNKIKKYPKKIVLPYNILPTVFLHLYKTIKIKSDIGVLFSGVMSKNDEARVCYGSVPKRLISYEKWQKELLEIYRLEDSFFKKYGTKIQANQKNIIYNQPWYGSKLYFNGTKFNIFLQKLLALSCTSELDRLNLKFIFLKYALSCLMATRHYKYSTSMEQYSRRAGLIFIQEKGRNLFSGKRIIPLTEQAIELVETFLSLRREYDIMSYSPCIVSYLQNGDKKEKVMRRGDIETWFQERRSDDNSDEIDYILKFITNVPLNFGRHVFTSIALQDSKLSADYLDAFLGHYKMGTEDQGIYSNFNNEKYYKEIRQIMNEVGMEYLPNDWKDIW